MPAFPCLPEEQVPSLLLASQPHLCRFLHLALPIARCLLFSLHDFVVGLSTIPLSLGSTTAPGAKFVPACLVVSDFLTLGLQPTSFFCPWGFLGKNTGAGCHFLLQGIFQTQGSNLHLLCLLHCRQILYPLSPQERP